MKIFLFFISILLLLAFWPKNEAQRQVWNRFWAIREAPSQEENQIRQKQTQEPLADSNLTKASIPDPKLFRLQKKPLPPGLGESQFEYILRRW